MVDVRGLIKVSSIMLRITTIISNMLNMSLALILFILISPCFQCWLYAQIDFKILLAHANLRFLLLLLCRWFFYYFFH